MATFSPFPCPVPQIHPWPPHSGYHGPDRNGWGGPPPRFGQGSGSFFEGWYFRLTLPQPWPALAFMYSIQDPHGPLPAAPGSHQGGTVQILDEADRYVCRSFPQVDRFWADRHRLALGHWGRAAAPPASSDRLPSSRPLPPSTFHTHLTEGYQIVPHGSGSLHQGRFWDPLRQETIAWHYHLEPVYGWGNPGHPQATGGWLSALPIFEPGWQVLMALAWATGWVEWQGQRYEFRQVPAYGEKNWGGAFPDRWFWLNSHSFRQGGQTPAPQNPVHPEERHSHQADPQSVYSQSAYSQSAYSTSVYSPQAYAEPVHPESAQGLAMSDLSLTVAGGRRQVLGRSEEVGLVGIHVQGRFYEFAPWNSRLRWLVTWGRWHVWAENATHWVEIEAETGEPGAWVRVPTAEGMQFRCRDSLRGHLTLRLGERRADRRLAPLFQVESDRAGVEVGGLGWDGIWQGG